MGADHASREPSQINALPVNQQRHREERPGRETAAPRFLPGTALGQVGRRRAERWEIAVEAAEGGGRRRQAAVSARSRQRRAAHGVSTALNAL